LPDESHTPHPFDVRTIRYLVRLMSEHDLSEIDLSEGEHRIRLRRGRPAAHAAAPPAAAGPVPAPAAPPAKPEPPARKLLEIKSQAVGTFYAQKEPGSPPYVSVGSRLTPATVVGQIEAMKVFNEIQAECSGVVAEVCVKNKDFVEYNTVLFRVDPAG
jgi:acetyl-CoA carboxylase biotin carboxyl carrier protein